MQANGQQVHQAAPEGRTSVVMTAEEVAAFLNLPRYTVYELAKRGELPVVRLGRQLRFSRRKIEAMFE